MPISLMLLLVSFPSQESNAQIAVLEVIKAGVKKVIKAVDLKIQRMQNETIWLQNAQKVLENQLSKLKLQEIAGWSERQKELYGNYFQELWKVKAAISYYQRIKEMTSLQLALVNEYNRAWNLIRQDEHFTLKELNYMEEVYSGILDASLKNMDQIMLVLNAFNTSMNDAQRLKIINAAADEIQTNYTDLKQFNNQNVMLSLQRSKSTAEINSVKRLYGIN
ncbi:Conjugative transposon protein TraI [Arcticibacter svalbardensis MN12-7]|uniref:Conjugative transposon protein TraI n=2 Tax=Arcticibacter TaxID=1288026 RepID=R9GWY6_9SPHI|nr:Conjugative transposon protein TraI [Arcticibacter svalbardensis MN12-7]